jgi:SH3 domain-containing protein
MSTGSLPISHNSESIRPMKQLASIRRLNVATLSTLLLLAMPLVGVAQDETVPGEQQQSEPAPAVRKVFVSDKLVLNVYSEPDQAGSRIATIETGDAVEELERDQSFVRIRLSDGREGWVGANYLTTDAPAAVQLRELQRQQKSSSQSDKKSADEIARLRKESEALQAQVKELKATAAAAPAAADDGVLEGASPTPQQLAAVAQPPAGVSVWIWSLVVVLAAVIAYVAGYQTLARRIHKKFGGLRIY